MHRPSVISTTKGNSSFEEQSEACGWKIQKASSHHWHHRWQRSLLHAGTAQHQGSLHQNALWRSLRRHFTGLLEGKTVAFLARHGRGHRILPTEINYRANIYALKLLGVDRIISVSAVGSLKENLVPGEFLVADQFVDRTRHRVSTFFGAGLVAHVTFDKPTCPQVSRVL